MINGLDRTLPTPVGQRMRIYHWTRIGQHRDPFYTIVIESQHSSDPRHCCDNVVNGSSLGPFVLMCDDPLA